MLWLETRGSVCPIMHTPLTTEDLKSDDALKTEIMRHHIQRSFQKQKAMPGDKSAGAAGDDHGMIGDDLYDF